MTDANDVPMWAIDAANIIMNRHSNYEALHNPAGLRNLFAQIILDAAPAPQPDAVELGAELIEWAADEINALDMFENHNNGREVWWCNFCSGDLSYESKDEIEHSPDCLHLCAKAIVAASAVRAATRETEGEG